MKQCVACGRRYGDTEVACPKCYNPDWVTPQNEAVAHIASTSFVCRHCITLVEGGTARCPNCHGRLAPGLLTLFCMVGLFGIPLIIAFSIYSYYAISRAESLWLMPDAALGVLAFPIIYGLMQAHTWAWHAARVLIILSLVLVVAMVVVANQQDNMEMAAKLAGMLVTRFIGLLPLWIYLDTRDLREYCGIVFNSRD